MSTQREMENLFTDLHSLLGAGDLEAVDEILQFLEGPILLQVGTLRAAFPVKDRLPSWGPALKRVGKRLERVGRKHLLRGLT